MNKHLRQWRQWLKGLLNSAQRVWQCVLQTLSRVGQAVSAYWQRNVARYRRWRRRFLITFAILSLVLASVIIGAQVWIDQASKGRLYDSVADIPFRPVGLLLGTSKWAATGRVNLYFRYRIDAAVALYEAGKIQHIIASGDNHRRGYNEPVDMMEALEARGIPRSAITLDYAGFRTLDSVVRANAVFSQQEFTVISQAFHNKRAIFIGQYYDFDMIGFNAQEVFPSVHFKTQLREYLARVKAVLDLYVLGTQPRFFGDKVPIELPSLEPEPVGDEVVNVKDGIVP